jgi:hypothetical protein
MLPPADQTGAIIERGERSKRLLSDDTFRWIVDDQTHYHLAALVAAPPGPKGADAVAYHHLQQNALSELVATLQGYQQAGEAMVNALNDPDEDNLVGLD